MMRVSIACIGPEDLVRQAQAEAAKEPDIQFVAVPYGSENESVEKVAGIQDQVDAILFTGPVPYYIVQKSQVLNRPAAYVSLSGAGLYLVLAQILHNGEDPSRASIDTFSRATVKEVYQEIGIPVRSRVREYSLGVSSQELVDFHAGLYQRGLSTVAITCLRSTYDALVALHIPAYRVVPTSQSIRDALRTAFLEGLSHKLGYSQIAICILELEGGSGTGDSSRSTYEVEEARLKVHQLLLREARRVGISVTYTGNGSFLMVATRGALEELTHGFSEAPFTDILGKDSGYAANVGIGLGRSAYEAEVNARVALARAKDTGGIARETAGEARDTGGEARATGGNLGGSPGGSGRAFVFFESEGFIGPLTYKRSDECDTGLDDASVAISRHLGLKLGTVIRLQNFAKDKRDAAFSPAELGSYLGISQRSARRLLDLLSSKGAAHLVGKDGSPARGRPHNLYRLHQPLADVTGAPPWVSGK